MRDVDTVRDEIAAKSPQLHRHLVPERNWLWYTGPSLQGEDNAALREILKDAGFIWAKGGHELVDEESGAAFEGSWGHCCGHPQKFRRREKVKTPEGDDGEATAQPTSFNPLAALANLRIA